MADRAAAIGAVFRAIATCDLPAADRVGIARALWRQVERLAVDPRAMGADDALTALGLRRVVYGTRDEGTKG